MDASRLRKLFVVLVPAAFVAVTVNVYAVAFVSPVTVMGEVVPVAVMSSGLLVTV